MTAPEPSPVSALCDRLEQLRAAATPLPWVEDEDGEWIWGDASDDAFGELVSKGVDLSPTDNALIVSAVNAVPHLIAEVRRQAAALRAVEALHQPLDRGTGPQCQGCSTHVTFTPWPCPTLNAALATAAGA